MLAYNGSSWRRFQVAYVAMQSCLTMCALISILGDVWSAALLLLVFPAVNGVTVELNNGGATAEVVISPLACQVPRGLHPRSMSVRSTTELEAVKATNTACNNANDLNESDGSTGDGNNDNSSGSPGQGAVMAVQRTACAWT